MTREKVAVFIDGSNLYYKLKDLEIQHTTEFNYLGLAKKLARDRDMVYLGYYVGAVRAKPGDVKSESLRKSQRIFFNLLRKAGIVIKKGYLLESGGKYHEKGVDVQIATDLLIGAYENQYDIALLISSDNDLIPAIKKICSLGKQVDYIGFSHKPSFGLIQEASRSYLLPREELEEYVHQE